MSKMNEIATAVTLANGCDLVAEVIQEIAGNEISTHLNGSAITRDTINGLSMATFNQELETRHAE